MENVIKSKKKFNKAINNFMDRYFDTTTVNGVKVVDATADYVCSNFYEIFVDGSYSLNEGYNKFLENVKLSDEASSVVCDYIHDALLVDRIFDDAFGLKSSDNIFEHEDYETFLDTIAQEVFSSRILLINSLQLFIETLESNGFSVFLKAVDKNN